MAAPFIFRTYKARPSSQVEVPLTAEEKQNLAGLLQSPFCLRPRTPNDKWICNYERQDLERGTQFLNAPDPLKYLALNVGAAAATFASIFALSYLIPMLIRAIILLARSYWQWLNA